MANSTIGTLITRAENILKTDKDTIGIPGLESTQLLSFGDQANREYVDAHIVGGGEPPLSMRLEAGFDLVSDTQLNGAVATTDTTITVDSSANFLTAGVFAIWNSEQPDLVQHTGNAANVFSGVTLIGVAHADGEDVQRLYQLPTNFGSLRSTNEAPDGVLVEGIPHVLTSGRPYGNKFVIHDDGTSKHLWLAQGKTGDAFVYYNKTTTVLDGTSDVVDVPVNDEYFIVWRIVEMGREILGLNADRIQLARQRADDILLSALKRRSMSKRVRTARMPIPPSISHLEHTKIKRDA